MFSFGTAILYTEACWVRFLCIGKPNFAYILVLFPNILNLVLKIHLFLAQLIICKLKLSLCDHLLHFVLILYIMNLCMDVDDLCECI